jgi:tetratricopeptide (TPR) repeat protein
MRHGRFERWFYFLSFLVVASLAVAQTQKKPADKPPAKADEPDDAKDKAEAEEEKERGIAERFRKVLETNPRRGTALDRLYGYHVERGTLDKLIAEYVDRTKKDAKDGTSWMIVGLIESQRGRDAAAVAAFRQAEANLPDSAMPSYYLGQSLILVGQPEKAADAFETAIARKPNRADLLDAFQALGRVYQRSQRTEKALEVWNRLEKLYPDDARVQEQIATTLVEEGQFDQALPRLVKLADAADDKYRQTTLRMDAADLKVKLKKTSDAIADFEKLLGELNPESWLYRDVRRRIEEVFLRNDDLAGLVKYYEGWLGKNKTDVDAIARLAKTLASQGRAPEARDWLSKGVTVAPNHRALRQALIDQYVFEQNYTAAAAQYEAMDKADPNNPDTLREWGKLIMRDVGKPEAERRAAASAIWRRLLEKKPNDPVAASQTADLMRTAGAVEDAIALYKKAIDLAPNAAQYREYLGEYYHSLKRGEEALATWRPIAEGPNRTSKNLARLAEVFAGFGYRKEAAAAMGEAISLEKDDFTMLMTYAELLHQENSNAEALTQIGIASKLVSNAEEAEQVLIAQIKIWQATEALGAQIDALQAELDAGKDVTADRWLRLARYYEANRQADKAAEAIVKAQAKDPKSVPAAIAAARIFESVGNLLAAAETNRKLAALDRRYRTEYLTAVTKLEQRLGRREQALQAARDLLAASPGNPEVYKFFSDLCFQLGDQEEGLEALRRSVRANPSDPQGLITLANALGERVRQGEAIELLWRALEKTPELDAKLGVVERITQLYLENNQFDRLLERLERDRREAEKAREASLCIAQAYTTAGDLGAARQQLERLLTENTRDTHLLGQLSTLCEQEGDLQAALKYQRQLNAAAPSNYDHQLRLAQLLTRTGDADEAADIWVRLVSKDTEPHRNLQAIDSLLTAGKFEGALAILSRLLLQKPGNWELMYREGAALAAMEKGEESATRFKAILALKHPDDEMSEITKHQIEQAKKKPATKPNMQGQLPSSTMSLAMANRYDEWSNPPLTRRTNNTWNVRQAVGMDPQNRVRGGGMQPVYVPSDYGEARMACLGWLYEVARNKGQGDAYIKQMRTDKDKAGADQHPLWDWYYFNVLRNEGKQVFPAAQALAKTADPAGLLALVNAVGSRTNSMMARGRRSRGGDKDLTPPLPADQLEQLLSAYRKLRQLKPDWAPSAVSTVMTELKRAGRDAEEKAIYQEMLKEAIVISRVQSGLTVASERNDLETYFELFARLDKLQPPAKTTAMLPQLPTRQSGWSLTTLMGKRSDDKKFDDVRKVLDLFLSVARRQNLTAVHSASTSRRPQTGGFSVNAYSRNQSYNNTQINYPSPNEYYDLASLQVLYNAFDLHKKGDLASDLFTHLEKKREAARGAERIYLQLALGYCHWWAGEKDEAIAELQQAVQSAPNDHNLILEVASLRELNGEFDAAMALLDSFTPVEMQVMQRREEFALRLAERAGDVERARQAADRLFGLRLDSDKQLELAGKMHRLGMHQLAETVLGRAQRQAGSKTATLVRLMNQYQSQNQIDLAVQIARQILRKGPSMQSNFRGGQNENDGARSQAINVLARSGQLKEIIERAEAQLKASPKSQQIYQALTGYYQAAGDKKKLKDALLKMAELKPADGKLRYQAAEQLQRMGERDAAIEQYKLAIKLEPGVFSNNYWGIQQLFTQANKFEELVQVFDEIDLRKLGSYWTITEPIQALLQQDKGKELGLKLFRKAWEAFPQYRGYILGRLYNEELWRLPEIYTFAKEAVIPREDSEADPWQAVTDISSYGQEGRVEGVVTRMMSIARKQQRLPELRAEVQAALDKRPDWTGGKALLAVIDIQLGNKEQGKKLWREVFDDPKADIPGLARFMLVQELEYYAGVEEMAVKALEGGIDELIRDSNYEFSYSPGRRLVWWYELVGRKEDAKKTMLRFASDERVNPGYGGGYWEYQRAQNGISVAQELVRTGDTVEAVRIYNRLLADPDLLDQANQYYGGERFDQQVEMGLKTAVKTLKPSSLPTAVGTLLTPREITSTDKAAIDLVLLVESRELSKATLNSLCAAAIKSTAKAPEVRREALAKLAELVKKYPTDHAVLTANVLGAFTEGKPAAIQEAVDQLAKLVDATPLEKLPANGKANARQRAEARLQVPIWLAARECLVKDREPLWPAGAKLAARAAEAAKRQNDALITVAVFREWGQLELDRGDKAKAETIWAELLQWTLPKQPAPKPAAQASPSVPGIFAPAPLTPAQPSKSSGGRAGGVSPLSLGGSRNGPQGANAPRSPVDSLLRLLVLFQVALPPAPAAPGSPAQPSPRRSSIIAPTEDQFKRAYEIALLASDKQMPELSLRTMRDSVRGGPPVAANENRRNFGGGPLMSKMINGTQYYVQGDGSRRVSVDQALLALIPKWRAQNVPPEKIYEVIVAAVLPDARPAEVFLYPPTQNYGIIYAISPGGYLTQATDVTDDSIEDRGLGKALIQVAIDAGKVADLRARLESRASQPLGELPAKIMLATLGVQAKDAALATATFKTLGERLQKDSLQSTNATIAAVLVPALNDPKYAELVVPLVDKAAQNYLTGGNTQPAADLRFRLAEYYLRKKDEAAAKAQFKLVEASDKKIGPGGFNIHMALAQEYLKLGWVEDALREFGFHADNPTDQRNPDEEEMGAGMPRAEPALQTPGQFERLAALLLRMPAAKRYEVLKAWSLPTTGRKSVRYYVGATPREVPPEIFSKRLPFPEHRTSSTMLMLVEAAKECGKIDELTAEAERLAKDKVESAELLRLLVYLVQGKGKTIEPALKAFAEAAHKRLTEKREQPLGFNRYYGGPDRQVAPLHPSEFLFAVLCLNDPSLAAHGEAVLAAMMGSMWAANDPDFGMRMRRVRDELDARRAGARNALASSPPPRWGSSAARTAWIAQDGYVTHIQSDQPSNLLFDYPLTGTFEFSVDLQSVGGAGYGGIAFLPGSAQISSTVPGDIIQQQQTGEQRPDFGRMTVQVSPGKIRCLMNDRLFYEDVNPAPTSPWLMLGGSQHAVYRNFTLTGKADIPAEVRLTAGDYLEGWQSHVYGGVLPQRLIARQKAEGGFDPNTRYGRRYYGGEEEPPETGEPVYDWVAKDGEIRGRKLDWPGEKPSPSSLAYYRPLRSGESLRYEFYHEPGKTHVHPSLGRVAFLLETDGVKLHWMTEGQGEDWAGLQPDNAVAVKAGPLTLKAGDWNKIALSVNDDRVRLDLNGTTVYDGKLDAMVERVFGLFHYRDRTTVRVRDVVLSGNWPKTLEGDSSLVTKPSAPAEVKLRRAQIGEALFASESGPLLERARKLPASERYALLADWVLPNERRPTYQLAGVLKPADVLGIVDQKQQPAGRRVLLGGRLDLPCLEMIDAAKEAGKLDDLCAQLAKAGSPAEDELDKRSRLALRVAALAAKGDDATASAALGELLPCVGKMKLDAPGQQRWPDLIAAQGALERSALRDPVAALLQAANKKLEEAVIKEIVPEDREWWMRVFRDLRANLELKRLPDAERWTTAEGRFVHWATVPGLNSGTRSLGAGVPRWLLRDGALVHLPGHGDDYLILNTPLRGDFEVSAELKLQGWQEVHVRYGSRQFDLKHDRKHYHLHTSVRSDGRETLILPPLPAAKTNVYQFRLAVKDGWLRCFVDGRELVAEKIGLNPEPWLMLHCPHQNTGEVRNLKIVGAPTVPERIDLLAEDDLGMWRPHLGQPWAKRGEEMFMAGAKPEPPEDGKPLPPRGYPEDAVYYQRPILEDGVIEYEFYYEPDKAHVHPMLDRLTFLLAPEGLKLHWLTDGVAEKTKTPVDNAVDEPSCRRGPAKLPLKPKAWNKVRLAVTGDVVKIALNGVEVYERAIEPTNQRLFGLFHYTDRTEARVRGMTYTGVWPKKVPTEAELFEVKK